MDPISGLHDLFDLPLEILPFHQIWDLVIIVPALSFLLVPHSALLLLHALVALGQLPQACQTVRAELVEDSWDKLGEFLVLAVAVDGEGVGGDGGVDCVVREQEVGEKTSRIKNGA